jgi:hypothetical protein
MILRTVQPKLSPWQSKTTFSQGLWTSLWSKAIVHESCDTFEPHLFLPLLVDLMGGIKTVVTVGLRSETIQAFSSI